MAQSAGIYYQFSSSNRSDLRAAVVLLHGAGGNHLYWPPGIRRLPDQDVYALDLPGHGRSEAIERPSIEGYASAITRWLSAINRQQVFLVGHSMGSAIALQLALTAPQSVAGLAVVGGSARLQVNPKLLVSMDDPATFRETIGEIIHWSFSKQSPARLKELATRRMADLSPGTLTQDFLACNGFDITCRLGEILCPAIVICGEEDRMTPPAQARFLAGGLPHAHLEIVPGAGHMLMLEQPQILADLLTGFFNQNQV